MICLTAILTEDYFLMSFIADGKKMEHKKNKNEFYDSSFEKRHGLVKHYALPKQVSSLTKQMIRESCSQ